MTIDEAIKQNPYDEKQNNLSAYVRYLRYNVDGFYNKTPEEVKAILAKTDIEKIYDSMRNAKAVRETNHECLDLGDGEVKVCAEYEVIP